VNFGAIWKLLNEVFNLFLFIQNGGVQTNMAINYNSGWRNLCIQMYTRIWTEGNRKLITSGTKCVEWLKY